jgi:hypothetical protein
MLRSIIKPIDTQSGHITTSGFLTGEAAFLRRQIAGRMTPAANKIIDGYKSARAYGSKKSKGAKYQSLR